MIQTLCKLMTIYDVCANNKREQKYSLTYFLDWDITVMQT